MYTQSLCIRKMILLITVFLSLCCGVKFSHASFQDHAAYNLGTMSIGYSGSTSNNYFQNMGLQLIPSGHSTITYIKGRVKYTGDAPVVSGDVRLNHSMNGYFDGSCSGNGNSFVTLISSSSSEIGLNNWRQFEVYLDPSQNQGNGNKNIWISARGNKYDSFYTTAEILEIKYRTYRFDSVLLTTPHNSSVKITLERGVAVPNTRIKVVNNTNNSTVFDKTGLSDSFFEVTDNNVIPEKTYSYSIYASIGANTSSASFHGDQTLEHIGTYTIKVPSDATIAADQTIDSGTTAAQWAHLSYDRASSAADDTTYMRNTLIPLIDAGINNLQTTVDSMNTSINNISMSVNTDTTPPAAKLRTVSGALATSGNQIQAVVDVSDNNSSVYTYSLDGVYFIPLPANKLINLPVTIPGLNAITVWVRDMAGNVCSATITIRKL